MFYEESFHYICEALVGVESGERGEEPKLFREFPRRNKAGVDHLKAVAFLIGILTSFDEGVV